MHSMFQQLKHLMDFSKGDWINQLNLVSAVNKSNKSTTTAKKKLSSQALVPIRKQIHNLNTGRTDFQSISKIKLNLPCKEALNTINKNFTVRNAHKFASILNYSCKALRSKHYSCTTYPLIEVYNRIPPKSTNGYIDLYTKGHSRSVNRTIERDVKPIKTSRTCLSNNYFMKTIGYRLDLTNSGCHKSIINNTAKSYLTTDSSSCCNGNNHCRNRSHPDSESKNRNEPPAVKKLPLSVRKLSQTPYKSNAAVSCQKSQAPAVCAAKKITPKSSEFPSVISNECAKTTVTCDHSNTHDVCKQLIKDSIQQRLECISPKDVCEKIRENDKCTTDLCKELILRNIQKHLDSQTIEPTCKIYMPQETKSITVEKIHDDEQKKPEIAENIDEKRRKEENVIQGKAHVSTHTPIEGPADTKLAKEVEGSPPKKKIKYESKPDSTCKAHVSTHTPIEGPADTKLAKEVEGSPSKKKIKYESKPDSTCKAHVSTLTPKKKSKPSNLKFADKVKSVFEDKILKSKLFLEIEDRLTKHQKKSSQQGHLFYIKKIPLNLLKRVLGGLDTKRDKKQFKTSKNKSKCEPWKESKTTKHVPEKSNLGSTTSGQPISHKKTEEVPTYSPSKQSESTTKTEPCKQPVTSKKHIPEKSNLCTPTSLQPSSNKKTEVVSTSTNITKPENMTKSKPCKDPIISKHAPEKSKSGQPSSHKKTEEIPTCSPSTQSERITKREQPMTRTHIPEKSSISTPCCKRAEKRSTTQDQSYPCNINIEKPDISCSKRRRTSGSKPEEHDTTSKSFKSDAQTDSNLNTCAPSNKNASSPEHCKSSRSWPCKPSKKECLIFTLNKPESKSSSAPSSPCAPTSKQITDPKPCNTGMSSPCQPDKEKCQSKTHEASSSSSRCSESTKTSVCDEKQMKMEPPCSSASAQSKTHESSSSSSRCSKSTKTSVCDKKPRCSSASAQSKTLKESSSSSRCSESTKTSVCDEKQMKMEPPCSSASAQSKTHEASSSSSRCSKSTKTSVCDKKPRCSSASAQSKTLKESSSSSRCSESTKTSVCDEKQMKMEPPCSSASAQSKTHEASSSSSRCSKSTKTSVCDKKPRCSSASAQSKTLKESSSSSRCSASTKKSVCNQEQMKMKPSCSSKSNSVAVAAAKAFLNKRISEQVCEKSSKPERSVSCDVEDAEFSECTCDSDLEQSSISNTITCASFNPYESISNNSVKAPSESKQTYRLRFKETLNKPACQTSDKSEVCDSDDDISNDKETICEEIKAVQGSNQHLRSKSKRPGEEEVHSKEKKRRIDLNQTDEESPCSVESDIEQEETGTKYGGIPSFIFQEKHSASEEISKKGVYKNPEYFSYHKTSFHDIVKLLENKFQPQPSSKKVPADTLSAKKSTSKEKGKGNKGS